MREQLAEVEAEAGPSLRELGYVYGQLRQRLPHLGEVRLQLGRPREVRAGEIALQLPLPEPEQQLGPGPLVERFLRRSRVELRAAAP